MSSLLWGVVGRRLLLHYWHFIAKFWFRYVFFRNVGKQLPIYKAQLPRRGKALTASQHKSRISHETCNILSKGTTISCPRRIKMCVVIQQRKERRSTCRTTPVSLDGYCSEIRFQTFHLEVDILRSQKIRSAYYNVSILQGEEKVRVHLYKNGVVVCWKRKVPYLQHCMCCKSRLNFRWDSS
jgi:hypothetical protein